MRNRQKIEEAKKVLEANGYFVESLWHIQDVKQHNPNITNKQAFDILRGVVHSNYIVTEINEEIKYLTS